MYTSESRFGYRPDLTYDAYGPSSIQASKKQSSYKNDITTLTGIKPVNYIPLESLVLREHNSNTSVRLVAIICKDGLQC
jgi:hypothetical protein